MLFQTCTKLTFGLSDVFVVTVIARNTINGAGSLLFRDRILRFGKNMPQNLKRFLSNLWLTVTCQLVYYHLHDIRQIRKFLRPVPPNCLYKAWSWQASITSMDFSMVYLLCVFPNCNVFSILLHDLSPIRPDTVILPSATCTALVTDEVPNFP